MHYVPNLFGAEAIPLLQILTIALFLNDIKQGFSAEEPSQGRPDRLVRESSILFMNLNGLTTSAASGCICHELSLAALLQADEPEDRRLYGLTYRQQAMVLQQRSFAVA
jgi:hypothetical protein